MAAAISRRALLIAAGAGVAGCAGNGSPGGSAPAATTNGSRAAPSFLGSGPHHVAYGADDSQWGELHLPVGARRRGVVVIIHGGFWLSEYGAELGTPLALDMAARGYPAWNLEYRRIGNGGGWPQTFQDVAAGIDHLSAISAGAGLDLGALVAIGHSAGGQLAVWAAGRSAADEADPRAASRVSLTGVVSQAGVLDLAAAAQDDLGGGAGQELLGGGPAAVPARYQVASPQQNLPNRVPVRCVHSHTDGLVPYSQSADYVAAAVRNGGDAELTTVAGDHFSLITTGTAAWQACAARAAELLAG